MKISFHKYINTNVKFDAKYYAAETLACSVGDTEAALAWDHIYLIFKCFLCFSKTVKLQQLLGSLNDLIMINNNYKRLQTWMGQKPRLSKNFQHTVECEY